MPFKVIWFIQSRVVPPNERTRNRLDFLVYFSFFNLLIIEIYYFQRFMFNFEFFLSGGVHISSN